MDIWFSQPVNAGSFPVGCTDVLLRGAVAAVAGLQSTHVAFKRQNFMANNWDKQEDTSLIFEHLCELISLIIRSRNIWSILKTESINVYIPNFKNMSLLPQQKKLTDSTVQNEWKLFDYVYTMHSLNIASTSLQTCFQHPQLNGSGKSRY